MNTLLEEAPRALDVDLRDYASTPDTTPPAMIPPEQVGEEDAAAMASVGVDTRAQRRSGTFIQRDFFPICLVALTPGVEFLPTSVALQQYDWLREELYWQAVPSDLDQYTTQCAEAGVEGGFFIRVKAGVKVPYPVQACLYMTQDNIVQTVHNIVVLEEGAELHLLTGCVMHPGIAAGAHIGVTESYVGPNARLVSTMIHNWSPDAEVRPHSGTIVGAGATYVENYCCLRPARSVQTYPRTWLNGPGASAKYMTIIMGSEGSTIDIGGEVYLNGDDTSAELAHRAVCTGGIIYQRGLLIGGARCRAHVDCAGMVLDTKNEGFIQSIPGLRSLHPEAHMSHEASIGKLAPEQVEYLQSRGMEEREAISLIIRGFLGADLFALGPELDARIAEMVELAGHGEA